LIVILGISTRKDIAEMVAEIVPVADHIIVTQASFRGNDPAFIAAEVRRLGCPCENTLNCQQALERALSLAKTHDLICCTGSLFLAGEVRRLWLSRKFAKVEEIG
jgi:dihydrofolate synthase/folylpolyglutamate synthase